MTYNLIPFKFIEKIWWNKTLVLLRHKFKIFLILFLIKIKSFRSIFIKEIGQQQNLDDIKEIFKYWASKKKQKYNIKDFIEENFIPSKVDTSKNYSIQQVEKEIFKFVEIILNKKLTHSILEIGLGYYGGTHILWRLIFNKVITIEIDIKNIKRFVMNETISFRDIFIIGNSQDPKIFKKTKKILRNINQVDVLFIDGDHSYESVKNDYFIYRKLVKKGGIIAFHDSFCTLEEIGFGVNRFLKELQEGLIDGKRHIINNIVFSQAVGISWEEKE